MSQPEKLQIRAGVNNCIWLFSMTASWIIQQMGVWVSV